MLERKNYNTGAIQISFLAYILFIPRRGSKGYKPRSFQSILILSWYEIVNYVRLPRC